MDTPKIPTLKDSQKPQVKVRGAAAGATLFDRLKQFKKKDLAFILAGLGTLFMAPLAEHFMMSPETGDGTLQQGWKGGSGGKGMFDGSGSSPYEPGTSGLAPGSAIGGGSDVITPLNVRDPSALVMGPGSTQQPPTSSVMPGNPPATAPSKPSDNDMKDALAASARGISAAGRHTLLPVPHIPLSGSGGLRGLGVVGGGSSASAGGGPISSNGLVSGKAASGGGLGSVRPAEGYKGVARGQTSSNGGGIDALKKAADAAGGAFNRGSALNALNSAASEVIPNNNGGALGGNGAGAKGSTDKAFGGDQSKDSKSVGESLAFLKAKAMQEAQIALWAKEQEAGDNKLEALKIRNSVMEAAANQATTAMVGSALCPWSAGGSVQSCYAGGGGSVTCTEGNPPPPVGANAGVCGTAAGPGKPSPFYYSNAPANTEVAQCPPGGTGVAVFHGCKTGGASGGGGGSGQGGASSGQKPATTAGTGVGGSYCNFCQTMKQADYKLLPKTGAGSQATYDADAAMCQQLSKDQTKATAKNALCATWTAGTGPSGP